VKELRQKRARAAEKLDDLESATAEGRDATKEGFVNAYRDLYDRRRMMVDGHEDAITTIDQTASTGWRWPHWQHGLPWELLHAAGT
jgi:hypothetical protein